MVTGTRDYPFAPESDRKMKVGVVIDGFNEMLEQIQKTGR